MLPSINRWVYHKIIIVLNVKSTIGRCFYVCNENFTWLQMPNYDPSYVEFLRKQLRSLVVSDVSLSPVRVTLEDLLLSETRGRWWVVGSAWTGASLETAATPTSSAAQNKQLQPSSEFSEGFLKLADTMRINRSPNINILFVLTLGSDSTDEAICKFTDMSLPPAQEKIIFEVMLVCIQRLRTYKTFYSELSNKLCNKDHKYKRMLQHSLWDKFSDLNGLKPKELKNVAKFIVEIVKVDSLNLSLFKTLPFADANKNIVDFLQNVLCQLFDADEGCHVSRDAFEKLFLSKKLQPLRLQLKIFISVFILAKLESGELEPNSRLFKKRVITALDLLAADHAALL